MIAKYISYAISAVLGATVAAHNASEIETWRAAASGLVVIATGWGLTAALYMHQETWNNIKFRVELKGRRIANRALLRINSENTCGEPNWRRWCRYCRWADHKGDHEYVASARDGRIQTRIRWANPPDRNDTDETN